MRLQLDSTEARCAGQARRGRCVRSAEACCDSRPGATRRRSRTRLVVQVVLSLVLVVAIFYFMVKKIDLAQVWAAITDMTWLELTTLGQHCACLPPDNGRLLEPSPTPCR
jgi:hypothetical protein